MDVLDEEIPETEVEKHRLLAAGAFWDHLLNTRETTVLEHPATLELPEPATALPASKQFGPYGARGHAYGLHVYEAPEGSNPAA